MSVSANADMDTSISPTSPASSPKALAGSVEAHPQYHFYDGSLSFELEGLHYRIHGSLVARHCSFTSTWAEDIREPATSGITRVDLDAFLSMIYLSTYEAIDLNIPVDSWISILRLATRWKAEGMRCLAVKRLTSLATAMEKLLLCRAFDVPVWLAPACAALALRPAPITITEADIMEKADIIRIFSAREAVYKGEVASTDDAVCLLISDWLSAEHPDFASAAATADASCIPRPGSAPASLHTSPNLPSSSVTSPTAPYASKAVTDGPLVMSLRNVNIDDANRHSAHTSTTGELPSRVSDYVASQQPSNSAPVAPTTILPTAASLPSHIQKAITDALHAIRAKRYDTTVSYITMKNVDAISQGFASEPFCQRGALSMEAMATLQGLLRATFRRGFRQPDFIPAGARFLFVLSKNAGVPLMTVLSDDLQSISTGWGIFKAGGTPTIDSGRVMGAIQNGFTREMYNVQMSHGKGFMRSLVRLEVLPADNEWVGSLIK
ncbi:hypothetical protein PENSPDRAFT_747711 [Peniophora sp. CONT]|nr:hypothetical protein PENSPDRAFT_747711 [Peniophora sp. CONT]